MALWRTVPDGCVRHTGLALTNPQQEEARAPLPRRWPMLGAVLVAALWGCAGLRAPARPVVHGWVTTADRASLLAPVDLALSPATSTPATILIDPGRRYQTMVGFGAAITDASAWLIQSRMDDGPRAALMKELFGPAPGLSISFVRLTIGASDFSARDYSLDDMPDGQEDPGLTHFSIAPERDAVLPVVRAALAENPGLRVMASPWSAPGWMKTTGNLLHGTLQPRYYQAFAAYLVKYTEAMEAEGVPMFALTLQNEPHFDPRNYPGMVLPAEARAELIGSYLGPALARRRSSTRILDWDHNWNRPQDPLTVLADPHAARYVAGVAWHCYEGKLAAQTLVHAAHPDKDAYLTECSGGDWQTRDPLLGMTRDLIIGSTRGWARGVLLWNLALDESRGPHLGGCATCRGLVTIDSRSGEVTRNPEYYVIAHASRFVRPGARRIESSEAGGTLDSVAFRNRDDGSIVLIIANSDPATRSVLVRCGTREFEFAMQGRSIATYTWR
jgi:glucosylceramidase